MNEENRNSKISEPTMKNSKDLGSQPVISPNKSNKRIVFISLAILLIAIAVGVFVLANQSSNQTNQSINNNQTSTNKDTPKQKEVEQVLINPVNGTKIQITQSNYYAVKAGESEYFGRVSKINSDYIRMLPTAYKKANALTFTGEELHGPEAATYFKISAISKFEVLTDKAIIDAVKVANSSTSDAFPSNVINKYPKSGQFQAFFFTDGTTFFAKITTLDGNFLANVSYVYSLQVAGSNSPGGTNPQVSLSRAKPDQYSTRKAADLMYWQNMKPGNKIADAANDFEKQNP